ncbi:MULTISPECIES: STAS domain-containing protein [unclassified Synechococcus]|jgi:anti-sigma B factor antagonist|uniref:STAS domain-containing protein n=1 Tax=unclassified Synechococcus TaxID=2626047 RepID=UPI001CF89CD6|nr:MULTISPECIES: STAS domain-containing protein [unclassified Synechococcus]MCB4412662.1 STAS domain-containing protein [Synechococcus sp. MU1611]|tara:strand:- start:30 stop:350 length:321 start_codon:yes stop_codon:yes gene_type:complete
MEVQQELIKNWQVIKVTGEIDSKTVSTLRDFIDEKLVEDTAVALDLEKVPFMSSAGLRTLLTLQRKTTSMKVDLALIGVANEIQDTMKVTGFLQYFKLYDSIESLP